MPAATPSPVQRRTLAASAFALVALVASLPVKALRTMPRQGNGQRPVARPANGGPRLKDGAATAMGAETRMTKARCDSVLQRQQWDRAVDNPVRIALPRAISSACDSVECDFLKPHVESRTPP